MPLCWLPSCRTRDIDYRMSDVWSLALEIALSKSSVCNIRILVFFSPSLSSLPFSLSLIFHQLCISPSFVCRVWHSLLFLSVSPSIQASLQNVKQRSAHWFQLFVLHQDGTLQPSLPDGQRQPPQPWWLFRRQWELQFNHEWPSERTWLTTSLPFCSYPGR